MMLIAFLGALAMTGPVGPVTVTHLAQCQPAADPAVCDAAWKDARTTFVEVSRCRSLLEDKYDFSHGQRPAAFQRESLAKCDHARCIARFEAAYRATASKLAGPLSPQQREKTRKYSEDECLMNWGS